VTGSTPVTEVAPGTGSAPLAAAVGTPRSMLAARVAATPDKLFLRSDNWSITFGAFDAAKRRAAGALYELGVRRGERVLIGMRNRLEAVIVQHAVTQLGAVVVPLVPGLTAEELLWQCSHSAAQTLVADPEAAALLTPHLARLPELRRTLLDVDEAIGHAEREPEPVADDPLAPWAILYTSGSTGRPKGVVLPAGAFGAGGTGYAERFGVRASDNCLLPTPLAHAVGALTVQSIALLKGNMITVVDRFSPRNFWQQVVDEQVTFAILFPAQLNLLLELQESGPARDQTPLRMVLTHAWHQRFQDRFGTELKLCWGMTETGAVSCGSEPGYDGSGPDGYIGPPWPFAEIASFGEAGERLVSGTVGEIRLRHPYVMLGYLDDPEANAATIADGWIRTGDRGYVDDEGHLVYQGRFKHVIKRSGENIGAEEVEAVLDVIPGVNESLVFGVPDRIRTEEVMAVVAAEPGAELSPTVLCAAAGTRLARWKIPRYVLVISGPLPRLPNGKLDRIGARASYSPDGAWDRSA
jgi:crotonobetaine/carnitine-CoA ligase